MNISKLDEVRKLNKYNLLTMIPFINYASIEINYLFHWKCKIYKGIFS